jgi:leucyl/phenylalanyl-tRNA---protein transferase
MPVYYLGEELVFPSPLLASPGGLLAIGGDLSPERLLLAYRTGVFPWYGDGNPILWWSPDPRLVLFPEEFHVARRLARVVRQGVFQVTRDAAFRDVIRACAQTRGPGREDTWITEEMMGAYIRLYEEGWAHSVEAWFENQLAGGLYGVSVGRAFFGESMFTRIPNASKAAMAHLVEHIKQRGFAFVDCQVHTQHLIRMGAREISRTQFLSLLDRAVMRQPQKLFT